jgi:hypothetical protein
MFKPINIAVAVLFVAVIGLGYMVMFQDSKETSELENHPVNSSSQPPTYNPAPSKKEAKPQLFTPSPTPCRETGIFNPRGIFKGKCETHEEFWERKNALTQEGRTCNRNGGKWDRHGGICTWK